jgi:ubiquinone/menaquinone biosynthesis C-methylase UbiE
MAVIDSLTSPTLKHLRERWWNNSFTQFLVERLKPRPGNRILDVGCGEGLAEVSLGRLQLSQVRLAGIDLFLHKVVQARQETQSHNQRVLLAAADAARLPFVDASFDSTYCVAVLQHMSEVELAVSEFARVTRDNGRVVVVEPDNAARYVYSSSPTGSVLFDTAVKLLAARAEARRESADTAVGPTLAERFTRHGIEPLEVRIFPVSHAFIGAPPADVWKERRQLMQDAVETVTSARVTALSREYFELLDQYERDATAAGAAFVEIQSTSLFATVGQRLERES